MFLMIQNARINLVIGENEMNKNTGRPRYMREIGTPKICSHIMNSNIKRPRITVN
jgi:hypothetical protein